MYISGAGQPLSPSGASTLLLDSLRVGGDAVLIGDGGVERVLLDRIAIRLASLRIRVLQACDVLPEIPGRSTSGIPDDEFLTQSYRALTILDETCDRIVLFVSDAQALQQSALRYIQFVSRSCGHLQLVVSGTHEFLHLLEAERFAWLRERLLAGQVVSLAESIPAVPDASPAIPFVPHIPAPMFADTAFRPGLPEPGFSAGVSSRKARLVPLALFCLGGAGWLALCIHNGAHTVPTTGKQGLVQPGILMQPAALAPDTRSNDRGVADAASGTKLATPDRPASDPSVTADGAPALKKLPVPDASSSLGDRSVAAASLHALEPAGIHPPKLAPGRASDVTVSQPAPTVPLAAAKGDPTPVVVAGTVQDLHAGPLPGLRALPPSEAAPRDVVAALPQSQARLLSSGTGERQRPEAVQFPDAPRSGVAAVALHSAAASNRKVRRIRLLPSPPMPLPADDPWIGAQPVSSTGDGSQRYIGSYTADADGVRVFHLDR